MPSKVQVATEAKAISAFHPFIPGCGYKDGDMAHVSPQVQLQDLAESASVLHAVSSPVSPQSQWQPLGKHEKRVCLRTEPTSKKWKEMKRRFPINNC